MIVKELVHKPYIISIQISDIQYIKFIHYMHRLGMGLKYKNRIIESEPENFLRIQSCLSTYECLKGINLASFFLSGADKIDQCLTNILRINSFHYATKKPVRWHRLTHDSLNKRDYTFSISGCRYRK